MKALAVVVLFMAFGFLMAEISPFNLVGEGGFAGKMAVYANGDTIAFVTKPLIPDTVRYRYSFDGGSTWQTTDLALPLMDEYCIPTLSHSAIGTIITTVKGYQSYTSSSANFTDFSSFVAQSLKSFDPVPYFEKNNGYLSGFSIDVPYPNKIMVNGSMQDFPYEHATVNGEYVAPLEFSDNDLSPEGEAQYYTGKNVVNGIVRTNNHLYIKQTEDGNNNGWPVFNQPVVIGANVISIPPNYPRDLVFRGGLVENAPPMEFGSLMPPPGNINVVGPPEYNPDRIVMVTVEGSGYTAMEGVVLSPRRVQADVWANYPEGTNVPPLFRNSFTVRDTMWSPLPGGTCAGMINFVNSKLMIKGSFSGNQTWWSSNDIELIGDVLVMGTTPPSDPVYNSFSRVNLISDRNIIIKYGYKEPFDSIRVHPNMGSDSDYQAPAGGGIHIYASLYALGNGEDAREQDGTFTFEYQHPHPSTPAVWYPVDVGGTYLYNWIDIHRNRYHQTANQPWPANIDYPWYNPLWPEPMPYLERGTVNIWGSVYQKRKGVIHRDYAGHPGGIWDISSGHYGGSSSPDAGFIDPVLGINMQTRNYPGAVGDGVGYKKNYKSDSRARIDIGFGENSVSTLWNLGMNLSNYNLPQGERRVYYRKPYTSYPQEKCFARRGDRAYYSVNNILVYTDMEEATDISGATSNGGVIRGIALKPNASPIVYQLAEIDSMFSMTVKDIDEASGSVSHQINLTVPSMLNDICVMPNGRRLVAWYQNQNTITLWELSPQNTLTHIEEWNISEEILPTMERLKTSRLHLMPSGEGRVEVFFYIPADATNPNSSASLYHAYASFTVSNEDYYVPTVPAIKLVAYPNPMRNELKLQIENAGAKHVTIDVYNIRGQLVHRIPLVGNADNAKVECTWNGMDKNNQRVANGVYLLRLVADNKPVITKRICRY